MARKHLYELLSEEQEPFSLQGFIDERRCQLRRPSSRETSSKQPPPPPPPPPATVELRQQLHLHPKRHSPPDSVSALCKGSSSFIHFRGSADAKRSPLSQLYNRKSPPSGSGFPTVLLETALRIQKQQQHSQKMRRRNNAGRNPSRGLRLGFLVSLMKRLIVRKRHLEIMGQEEGAAGFRVSVMDFLRWESCNGGDIKQGTTGKAGHKRREAVSPMGKPHYAPRAVRDRRNNQEGKGLQSCISCRCDTAAEEPPPMEQQTPAASPRHPSTERQLFGGTGDHGRPKPSYYEEEKEQFSPVSVLDPPFDEEDRHRHDHEQYYHEHRELGDPVGEELDAELQDSFQRSLAAVQKTKHELLSRIHRFERLADLDPVELVRRLAEEEEEEQDGTHGTTPDKVVEHMEEPVEGEEPLDVCQLVRVLLGVAGAGGAHLVAMIPVSMKRLVLDLADEEMGGNGIEPANGSGMPTALRVRQRLEAWKRTESSSITIDMMVGMDVGREGETWKRYPKQAQEVAAEVDACVFALLVDEVIEELYSGIVLTKHAIS